MTPRVDLPERLDALAEAARLAHGRLDPDVVAAAQAVVDRAGERLRFGGRHTVVALAGATGSGKSSLFNLLAGEPLAEVGVRRPTTSTAAACVWGADAAGPLLDWLDVPRRHRLAAAPDDPLDGLVLLDLPDHDSTTVSHRLEVDRLVGLVDAFVWVLDPQKYADAAVHDRYLRPLAGHANVMLVVLNQADRLTPAELDRCRADLRRLLAADGLANVPLVAASARTGAGVPELAGLLAERVQARRAAVERLSADVSVTAAGLAASCGTARPAMPADRSALLGALLDAAGVPTVTRAVERSHRARSRAATGWPVTRWARRLRPDPLRRLHLPGSGETAGRTSLPTPSPSSRARVSTAVRTLADRCAADLPDPWPSLLRRAAAGSEEALADRLDRAVAGTDLGVGRRPRWWAAVNGAQRLLALVAVVGGLWLLALFGLDYLRLPGPPLPRLGRAPLPTVLLVGGLLTGLLLALLCRPLNAAGARARAARARRRLAARIEQVAAAEVLAPLQAELDAHARLCAAVNRCRSERKVPTAV